MCLSIYNGDRGSLLNLPLELLRKILTWTVIASDDIREPATLRLVNRLFDREILEALYAAGAFGSIYWGGIVSGHRFPIPPSYRQSFDDAKIIPFLARFIARNLRPPCSISSYINDLVSCIMHGADEKAKFAAIRALCCQIHRYQTDGRTPGWEKGILLYSARQPGAMLPVTSEDFCMDIDAAVASVFLDASPLEEIIGKLENSGTLGHAQKSSKLFGTPLYAATCARRQDLVRYLLDSGHGESNSCCELLKAAIVNDDLEMIDLLMCSRYGVSRSGDEFQIAIIEAARFGRATILKRLLDYILDHDLRIALQGGLWWAALRNHLDAARLLIERNANVNSKYIWDGEQLYDSVWNMSPAMLAAWMGHSGLLRFLLQANKTQDDWDGTVGENLQAAITGNQVESVQVILDEARKFGETARMPNVHEWTNLLHEGLELKCTDAILYLLKEENIFGWPDCVAKEFPAVTIDVLQQACPLGGASTFEMLLEAGEILNIPTTTAARAEPASPMSSSMFLSHRPWINITVSYQEVSSSV